MASITLKNIKKIYPITAEEIKSNKRAAKKAKDLPPEEGFVPNLQITDQGVVAVQEFNLFIKDKEFVVLVGPSGCGKSTTLRMIAGLEEITEGELYIGDVLSNVISPRDRNIAMVFQNYSLYPHMTVYDNMAFSLKLAKMPKDEIDRKVREAAKTLEITEIPITYSYASYIKVLDKLEEKEPLFNGYDDECDPKADTFRFKIHVKRDFWNTYPDEASWLKLFGLQKNLNEQFNCEGPGGKVWEFSNVREILDAYIGVRLDYYSKQKDYLVNDLTEQLRKDISKYVFVQGVVDGKIVIGNKKVAEIEAVLDKTPRIMRLDGSYNYLLALPMRSMTEETLEKLKAEMFSLKADLDKVKAATPEDLWLEDLKGFKKLLD